MVLEWDQVTLTKSELNTMEGWSKGNVTPPFSIHVENALWGDRSYTRYTDRSDVVMDITEAGEISDNTGDSDHRQYLE